MVIPWVKIVWISDQKGYGLIATRKIPKGTLTFVQDGLDIVIPSEDLVKIDDKLLKYVEKYSYEDYSGNRIISWDLGKYMNHDDQANTLSTGYGFEIAIRDIAEGEEVTDDYRIFSTHHDLSFSKTYKRTCDLKPWPKKLLEKWDRQVKTALEDVTKIDQPLKDFVYKDIWQDVLKFQKDGNNYRSVGEALPLRYKLQMESVINHSNKLEK